MFDILELDEMLCLKLDQKSLLQCAKVNKQWNEAAVPFIWRTIPLWSWDRLREHVLEDYLQEQYLLEQQCLEDQPRPVKKPRQARFSKKAPPRLERWQKPDHLVILSRYGHCVRHVEGFDQLLKPQGSEKDCRSRQQSQAPEHPIPPSALDLSLHFLKRCPNALFDFEMSLEFFTSDTLFDFALTTILPKVSALTISGDYDDDISRIPVSLSKFQRVLAASFGHLSSLSLSIPKNQFVEESDAEGAEGATDIPKLEITAQPKRLKIHDIDSHSHFHDTDNHQEWSWIWRQCSQVQELEVHRLSRQAVNSLAQGIRASMPVLDRAIFGRNSTAVTSGGDGIELYDYQIGPILGAGTKGWKAVHFGYTAQAGWQTFNLLSQLGATLEEVSVVRVCNRIGLIRVLKECPRLRTLVAIDDDLHGAYEIPEIAVMDFIDWDPETKSLTPWPCALTLETLAIKIADVPGRNTRGGLRQEARHYNSVQQHLCQRLGEFVNLKVLKLGHTARINAIKRFNHKRSEYVFAESEVPRQNKCIHLTFATGLRKLEGLKKLEELHIPNMDHQIKDVREVKWMVENWPRLSRLHGIGPRTSAHKWLEAKHPEICLSRKHPGF
ncbi:hypothetical protein BG003_010157 [Podila horticola]|nr:hypothetical protein BG003_010157 [Podila horticola]